VTKRKKTGGRDFVVGKPGGPGRPPDPPALKEAKRLGKIEFEGLATKYLRMSRADLLAKADDETLSGLDSLIVSILLAGVLDGDQARAEWFLNRLLGKVTDKVEVSQPKPFVIVRSDGSALELGAAPVKEDE